MNAEFQIVDRAGTAIGDKGPHLFARAKRRYIDISLLEVVEQRLAVQPVDERAVWHAPSVIILEGIGQNPPGLLRMLQQ